MFANSKTSEEAKKLFSLLLGAMQVRECEGGEEGERERKRERERAL